MYNLRIMYFIGGEWSGSHWTITGLSLVSAMLQARKRAMQGCRAIVSRLVDDKAIYLLDPGETSEI